MNRTFEWGVIATFLSVLSVVHRRSARLTYFLHPKLRKVNAVLITLTLPRLRCMGSVPHDSSGFSGGGFARSVTQDCAGALTDSPKTSGFPWMAAQYWATGGTCHRFTNGGQHLLHPRGLCNAQIWCSVPCRDSNRPISPRADCCCHRLRVHHLTLHFTGLRFAAALLLQFSDWASYLAVICFLKAGGLHCFWCHRTGLPFSAFSSSPTAERSVTGAHFRSSRCAL